VSPVLLALAAVVALATGLVLGVVLGRGHERRPERKRHGNETVQLLIDVVADAMPVVGDRMASDAVVRRLAEALHADCAAVGVVDGDVLRLFGMFGFRVGIRDHALRKGEGLSGTVWATGKSQLVGDVRRTSSYVAGADSVLSGIYVPGHAGGRVTLVIAVESRQAGFFSSAELRLLEPVADLFANLLESRKLFRQAQQLEEQLLTQVGHEMRTPLTTILGSLTTLRQHIERLDATTRVDLLDGGLRATNRLERLVEALLMSARLDSGDVLFQSIETSLHASVADACSALGLPERIADAAAQDLRVAADASHLTTAIHQLMAAAGADPVVVAHAREGFADVSVSGPGLTGASLGLHLARRLVEAMGGQVHVEPVGDAIRATLRLRLVELPAQRQQSPDVLPSEPR
jgi:K+-sensing histidine kinase KdpD